jgi:protease IV
MSSSTEPAPQSSPAPQGRSPRRGRGSTLLLLFVTAMGLLVFLGSVGAVAYFMSDRTPPVAENSFLEIRIEDSLGDSPAQGGLFLDPEDAPPVLTDVVSAVRRAKDDARIDGVFLRLDGGRTGFAGAEELTDALAELRASGKPCVAYAEMYDTMSYLVASACDRVVMAPSGIGLVTGLAVSTTYYATAFEKLGVKAQMLHVGDFKSAVEPFERTEPSEPAALAMNEMLDGLWGAYVKRVAAGRGRTPEEVQGWVDRPSMSPKAMLASGMVDALAFPDEVRARLDTAKDEGWVASLSEPSTLTDEELKKRFTKLSDYLPRRDGLSGWDGKKKIAVVFAEGDIVSGEADGGLFGGGTVIADRTTRKWLEEIRQDEDIAAVVLRVNSPGGSGLASDMIWRDLERIKASGKPVVVSMGNYAASGGYYLATAGDWIVAEPSTLTGSIGVFGGKLTFGGTYDWLGLTQTTYKRGANADLLSTTSEFTEDGKAIYQAFLDNFYDTFLSRVTAARGITRDEAHAVAQGRVWTGEQALARKLVDELGGLDVALKKAAELGEVGSDYAVDRWPKSRSFFEVLLEDFEGRAAAPVRIELPLVDERAVRDIVVLERILAGGGVAAWLPGSPRIVQEFSPE